MEERRVKLRRHIQAARAWLLQADKSLERENDVQGDLKLMLAKAELAQTRSSRRAWAKKILPPLTALMIVGAVVLSGDPVESDEILPPPSQTATVEPLIEPPIEQSSIEPPSEVRPDELMILPPETSIVEPSEETIVEPTYEEPIYAEPIEEPIVEPTYEEPIYAEPTYEEPASEYYEPTYEPTVEPSEYYEPAIEPQYESAAVPTEDMQQLMLDAGQILRAK